jgi:deferrochelatase/peroxidase EfeB
MNDTLKTGVIRNNISFSDYFYRTRSDVPLLLEGYGDGLYNIHENITKLIFTAKLLNNKLVAQTNAQVYWDSQGSYDEMRMYQRAYDESDSNSLTI